MKVRKFTFNPFQENTYLLYDETKEAVIVDPGCYDQQEQQELASFIESNGLNPVRLLNTHAHIDHIFGNAFAADRYNLELELHAADTETLKRAASWSKQYGLDYTASPLAAKELNEGSSIAFGQTVLEVLHVPGHAPGHVVFLNPKEQIIIGGDVLFRGSIGRTDLPGGDHDLLISSIKNKLFTLEQDYKIYSGHGPETTLSYEKAHNPFF
jgi:glyoxylase-like metal-dependent hydrolase (beta-lactamase superfamily II)